MYIYIYICDKIYCYVFFYHTMDRNIAELSLIKTEIKMTPKGLHVIDKRVSSGFWIPKCNILRHWKVVHELAMYSIIFAER